MFPCFYADISRLGTIADEAGKKHYPKLELVITQQCSLFRRVRFSEKKYLKLVFLIILSGEKLTKEEAKNLMKELCDPEDDEGFMPFMRKFKNT